MSLINANIEMIEIAGEKFILSERFARDVNKLITYSISKTDKTFTDFLIEAAIVLEDALKVNYVNRYFIDPRKYRYRKLLGRESLISILTPRQIFDLANKVYELEGVDTKKKVMTETAQELAEPLQSH